MFARPKASAKSKVRELGGQPGPFIWHVCQTQVNVGYACFPDPSNVSLTYLPTQGVWTWRQPRPKCVDLVGNQVQSNVSLACLLDPSKHVLDTFARPGCLDLADTKSKVT
jgi:hypothetical protein